MTISGLSVAMNQALATGRIGTPVAARIVASVAGVHEDAPAWLAHLVREGLGWLCRAVPMQLFAHGNIQAGHLTVQVRCQRGESLVVAVAPRGALGPALDAIVFGNHGLLSWEGDSRHSNAQSAPTADDPTFLVAARRSLQLRTAVSWTEATGREAVGGEVEEVEGQRFDLHRRATRPPVRPPFGLLLVAGDHTHQPNYAEAFLADSRCRLVGVCDAAPSPQRAELNARLAARLQSRVFPDLREALQRPDVQIVSICAEPERRAPIILAAAAENRHLYLDKPLCATVEEATKIVAASRKSGVLAHMFSQVRWDPATRARRILETGEVGELLAVHCDLCFAKGHVGGAQLGVPRSEAVGPTNFELPDAKRELTNIGVYGVTTLLWLLRRQVRRVYASTGNFFFAEHQARDMEDFGQMVLELDGGLTASVTAGRTGWQSHPAGGLNRITLVGEKGTVVVDAHRPRVEIWSDAVPWSPPPRDPDDPLSMWAAQPNSPFKAIPKTDWTATSAPTIRSDVAHFLDCLEQGRDTEMPVEIAASATEVLLAAYRSAATSRVTVLKT